MQEVSRDLRVVEGEIQSRVSSTSLLCQRLIALESKVEKKIQDLEYEKEEINQKFEQMNLTNDRLTKKSMSIFKTLQTLSKKFSSSYENQELFLSLIHI